MIIESIWLLFLGFIVGRIGDYLIGHWNTLHHWVHGVAFIVPGIYFDDSLFWGRVAFFGIGLIISDLEDLRSMRVYGPDEKTEKRFWGFD